jgi:hypothetical protein
MLPLLVAATLLTAPDRVEAYDSAAQAAASMADQMQTGTLIFSSGDCLAIKVFTASRYTHVGAVVLRDGKPYVYESANGTGVRRVTLERYLDYQSTDVFYVFQPREPFSDECAAVFTNRLESQLGRPYSIKHHLTGRRAKGMHCSEYVTDALSAAELVRVKKAPRVSPASLADGILEMGLYEPRGTAVIVEPVPKRVAGDNWCERMWSRSKRCTLGCCDQMARWFCCK